MPSRARTPGTHVPADRELLNLVLERPGITLRELAAAVWPDLPWLPHGIGRCATGTAWRWQVPPRPGVQGNRVRSQTAAGWLNDRMQDLIARGLITHGPQARGEVDRLAGLTYQPRTTVAEGDEPNGPQDPTEGR